MANVTSTPLSRKVMKEARDLIETMKVMEPREITLENVFYYVQAISLKYFNPFSVYTEENKIVLSQQGTIVGIMPYQGERLGIIYGNGII